MKIDFRNLPNPFLLAPMAEITHCAFRKIVGRFGNCGILFSEMLSARGLPKEKLSISPMTRRVQNDSPLFYQLLAVEPEHVKPAIDALMQFEPDGIDINMGCPAPEIISQGGGIYLRKDTDKARKILTAARKAWKGALTVKTRLGWKLDMKELRDFVNMIADCGADALILHPRLKNEKLKRRARWELLPEIKSFCPLPLIGNGDIESAEDALEKTKRFGCDAVMIGRAAAKQPWIFLHIREIRNGNNITPVDMPAVWLEFTDNLKEFFEEKAALARLKVFTRWYAGNFFHSHVFWKAVNRAKTLDEAINAGQDFFERCLSNP